MDQLKKNHSEVRLSASQVADELFNRSHAFREILVNHLNIFLALTTGKCSHRVQGGFMYTDNALHLELLSSILLTLQKAFGFFKVPFLF